MVLIAPPTKEIRERVNSALVCSAYIRLFFHLMLEIVSALLGVEFSICARN